MSRGRRLLRVLPTAFQASTLLCSILLTCFSGLVYSADVTLNSIEIFSKHEWLPSKPKVYFRCNGENKTVLPDVTKVLEPYIFKGEESWQPLTEFPNKKCKRCGLYEEDLISDDVFDEWELCPSDFIDHDGKYTHFKDKQFNATFLCPDCVPRGQDLNNTTIPSNNKEERKGLHWAVVATIVIIVAIVFILGLVVAYKYWQKRKREQEQARFLRLFEDGDDIEDELELGNFQ
ncbi:uncharacterized protein LOC124915082 [Impatiens glandulifera]|uniref:uncharacterized protein LOC124915082 n=1 Tax=Impatiens glandulifera TaxID=253017 RepID=UPI001FB160A5|nr:uncharacterized protein LOC124915082 [Impatiens glandulifera]